MKNRIEIKGYKNTMKVVKALFESGYSIAIIYTGHEIPDDEKNYYIIEYVFTKFGEGTFIIEEYE